MIWLTLCSAALRGQQAPSGPQQVTLGWTASSAPGVAGYYLSCGTNTGVYTNQIDVGTNTTFTVGGLAVGLTYYFSVASYNAAGFEGVYSPAVSYIVPQILTVTAVSVSRAFGHANPVFTGVITGVTNSDEITAAYSCSATNNSPVGTYPITPTLADSNNLQTYYSVNLVNGILTVTQAVPLVIWTNPAPVLYGAALASNQLNAAANVPGSFAYNPTNSRVLNSGTNTLSVIFTPTDTVDYSSATNTVGLVVSKAPLTVTASNASRLYGAANPVFAGAITGLTNGDNITAAYSCTATSNSPASTYPITPTLVDPDNRQTNYTVTLINGMLDVGFLLHIDTSNIGGAGAQLTMSGSPGQVYEIQASTNLVDWVSLNTVTADPAGSIQFLDAAAADCPQRFYRAKTQ